MALDLVISGGTIAPCQHEQVPIGCQATATLVNGAVIFENGEATGARSGVVLKGRLAS